MNVNEINVLVLAYLGDNIYEYYVRRYLIEKKVANVNELQKSAVNYVSAVNQSRFLNSMVENNFLTSEELSVVKRARNHKTGSHRSHLHTSCMKCWFRLS